MQETIVFIHGMFQNPKSWEKWINYFTEKGFNCIAPAWPYHEGEPTYLRDNVPAELGELRLKQIVDHYQFIIKDLPGLPILIGHSVGGLIVQLLVNGGLGQLGVPISSVAPNAMLAFDWDFFKNSLSIANPLKGDEPFYMTPEGFHTSFCNTLSNSDAQAAYEHTATHDSRNVLRDCMSDDGFVELTVPHVPLLFIGGEEDRIIPSALNEKNAKAYENEASITDITIYPNRSHYICNEPGWEEIAQRVFEWIQVYKQKGLENLEAPNNI